MALGKVAEVPGSSETFTVAATLAPAPARDTDLAFTAITQPCPWPKAYGGDLVAQAAVAAMRSVDAGKELHSMHSYFLRPADIAAEVRYEVELLRDGRAYSTRQVRAFQNRKVIFVCLASFAADAASGIYAAAFPANVPAPEALPTAAAYLAGRSGGTMTDEARDYWSAGRSFDMRHVPGPVYLTIDGDRTAQQAVWVRAFDGLRAVPGLSDSQRDTAALAYVCDYTILEPVLRVLGLPWASDGLVTASLDHAMWFHRRAPLEGWLLYAQEAVSAAHGRGVGIGRFYAADHTHLATVVQEGLIHHRPEGTS